MNIQHQDQDGKGRFFIMLTEEMLGAEITYIWNDSTHFTIDHTWVDEFYRGQGVAKKLFDAVIAFAREKNVKIIPVCSYAVAMFQRDSKIADLLYSD